MNKNKAITEAYYTALMDRNITTIAQYLHPDVSLLGPRQDIRGKDAVLAATTDFINFFKDMTVRARFWSEDQAMFVYDLEAPAPFGIFPTAALMTMRDGLIAKIEFFWDTSAFDRK